MKLATEAGIAARARKDEKPNIDKGGRAWSIVNLTIEGTPTMGLIQTHWLYFEHNKQWYKLDTDKYKLDPTKPLKLSIRAETPLSEEDKKAAKKARREARKAAKAEQA